jgi:hypothetical protein
VLLHELGHEVGDAVDAESPALDKALGEEVADLPPREQARLSYFSSPAEAFAEFFAERYDPKLSGRGRAGARVFLILS